MVSETAENIPGNAEAREKLQRVLESGDAIAFVGAGASAQHFPTWPGLIESLVQIALKEKQADDPMAQYWRDEAQYYPDDVAAGLKHALGNRFWHHVRMLFEKRDGPSYTETHLRIMQMPFRGYVTTNYDRGLLEAHRVAVPSAFSVDYCTWSNDQKIRKWHTDEVFDSAEKPILHAHGIHDEPDDLVLCTEDYRRAYAPNTSYEQLFRKLWGQCRLVFIGFGFSDPWLSYGVVQSILQGTVPAAAQDPRHVAIQRMDRPYTPEMRRSLRDRFDVEPLYYRAPLDAKGNADYSELTRILEAHAEQSEYTTE